MLRVFVERPDASGRRPRDFGAQPRDGRESSWRHDYLEGSSVWRWIGCPEHLGTTPLV